MYTDNYRSLDLDERSSRALPRRIRPHSILLGVALGLATATFATPSYGQLPDASGAALGLGDNYTVLARGRNAVSWNPAGLGMPGNPLFSISIAPLRATGTIGPIGPRDLVEVGDRLLTHDEKVAWLNRITELGRQQGSLGLDVTYLSMNIGRLGLQLSTTMAGAADISPGAAELLLFGNAGLTGLPRAFSFEQSGFTMALTSTAAVSYGHPIHLIPGQDLAVGATLNYTVGHALFNGRDSGSHFNSDPLTASISFPVVHTDTTMRLDNGSGFGLDLGASWRSGPLQVGVALKNLFNNFAWDEETLFYTSGSMIISSDSTESDFESYQIADAPAAIKAQARKLTEEFRYRPQLAIGAAFNPLSSLTLVGEMRYQSSEAISRESATHLGVGVEFRPIRFLPLRGGVTRTPDGHQISGGIGLEFKLINLQVSAARRAGDTGEGGVGMVVLSLGGI